MKKPMQLPSLGRHLPRLNPGERGIVVGPTGSGKTFLAKEQLLKPLPQRIIVISPKCSWDWNSEDPRFQRIATSVRELAQQIVEDDRAGKRMQTYRLYVPLTEYQRQNVHRIDLLFKWAMDMGDTCVVVDDAYEFTGGSSSHQEVQKRLPHFVRAITQGRESLVTVLLLPQRAHNIPLIAFTESTFRATFFLCDASDQDRMEKFCGVIPWDVLVQNDYSFIWATNRGRSDVLRLDPEPQLTPA